LGLIRYGSCDADLTYRLQAPQLHEQMEGFDDRGVGCWAVSAVHLFLHPVGDKEDGGARCRFAAWNTLEYRTFGAGFAPRLVIRAPGH